MLRYGFSLVVLLVSLIACQAPALPTIAVPRTPTVASPTVVAPTAAATTVAAVAASPTTAVATAAPTSGPVVVVPTSTTAPTAAPTTTTAATATVAQTRVITATTTPTQTVAAGAAVTATVESAATVTSTLAVSPTLAAAPPQATETIRATETVTATSELTATETVTATSELTVTATLTPTARPRATAAPTAGPAVLSQILPGQRITAFYVNPDGSIIYGVAPSDESLQFPANPVFQLWRMPADGGAPYAITPATMRMIGGVVVHNGTIWFNELGTLRRMPDNGSVSEGEVVIRYPAYENNKNLPYGHMNNGLAVYNLNGQEVLLMSMGSILDSSFPGPGLPANIAEPYYEDFPTGRINYATFDWLEQQHEYVATHGIAGQYDEFARGVRNPWSLTVGNVNGQTHVLAVDNDPAFTPEKYDNILDNAGDEVNDIVQGGNYGHPYFYGGSQPLARFPDTSVPSGVAVADNKIFVALQVGNKIVKVDPVKHTYTTVIENIFPFNMFARGNTLYISNFDGIHIIDASGL